MATIGRQNVDELWLHLRGGLWHSTHPVRFASILRSRAILTRPPVSDRSRYASGPSYRGTRSIGGISLFDFRAEKIDVDGIEQDCRDFRWSHWLPYHHAWRGAVWIELHGEKLPGELISATSLQLEHGCRAIIPAVEAAHIGDITVSAFDRIILILDNWPKYEIFDAKAFIDSGDGTSKFLRLVRRWHRVCEESLDKCWLRA